MEQGKVAAAFVRAQKKFAPALKDTNNPFFKSKYADLSACVNSVLDALNSEGIGLIQNTHEDSGGVCVETVLMHESGEQISCGKLHVPASKQDAQGYGSALTYARRYSLMAACGIAPEDDDGNAASRVVTPVKSVQPTRVDHRHEMSIADTLESLKEVFAAAWKETKGAERTSMKEFYDMRVKELSEKSGDDLP